MLSDPMQELIEAAKRVDALLAVIEGAVRRDSPEYRERTIAALDDMRRALSHLPALKAAGGWRPSREEVIEVINRVVVAEYTGDCCGMDDVTLYRVEEAAASILALGAVPEGGEERNSASVDEIGGSPPAAAKSDGQSSAGWRDIASAPKDGARVDLFDGRNINERCWWAAMELDGYGWANSWTGFCPTHWRPYTPAECSANSPSANG